MADLEVPNPEKFKKWLEPLQKSAKQKLEPLKISFAKAKRNPTDCAKEFKTKLTDEDLYSQCRYYLHRSPPMLMHGNLKSAISRPCQRRSLHDMTMFM